MSGWYAPLHDLIGHSGEPLTLLQILLRGLGVLVLGLLLFRLAAPRIFSRATPIDIVLAVIIGSNLSRTITGNAPFFETLTVTAMLVLLHSVLAKLAARWKPLATLVKGKSHVLAKDQVIDWSAMRKGAVGSRDLLAAVRSAGGRSLNDIDLAVLERGGDIQVILVQKGMGDAENDGEAPPHDESDEGGGGRKGPAGSSRDRENSIA